MTHVSDDTSAQTPLMRQYWELKAQAGDALLLFRMGDFYELFGEDAVEAARLLEITLTSRDKNKPNPMPMAGVPHHSVASYLQRLLKAGKKVAIAEQIEELASGSEKKIVRRELSRVFTPGVQFDLEGAEANYLAAALPVSADTAVLACLDVSTGEALVSNEPLPHVTLAAEIQSLPIRHVLTLQNATPGGIPAASPQLLVESLPPNYLSDEQAREILLRHYEPGIIEGFLQRRESARAMAILISYALRSQQQERLSHLRVPAPLRRPQTLVLGPRTAQHLDLVPGDPGTPSLYGFIQRTRSAPGARQLKGWLLSPLREPEQIAERQAAVKELHETRRIQALSAELANVYDLERILARVTTRLANPRDTYALGLSLEAIDKLAATMTQSAFASPLLVRLGEDLARLSRELEPLRSEILRTQRQEAPLIAREGGIFGPGTTPELDRLLSLTENGQRWLVELEAREREATGIPSLKIRYNRVFGYYIEITQANLRNVPSHYQRKQTMVGAERFFTEELKKFEEEILTASVRQKALELELFQELIARIQASAASVMEAARGIGELDSLTALARLAGEPGWCFPRIDDSLELEITAGRHPLLDTATNGAFVPNDLSLSPSSRLTLLITGPNMGGKSTLMRQAALIVILGQMGAPVPAERASWGAVSAVYTRIGAHDAIARGQSTFMVEMSELAQILHQADPRALLVLDEIGRGTSTYDGISVAWATLEWICATIRARTLFATHYHELTQLAHSLPALANAHMAVESNGAGGGAKQGRSAAFRFLYQLREGPTNESFGIHVARLAGLPKPVVDRAWKVLAELESGGRSAGTAAAHPDQLSLFIPEAASDPAEAPAHPALPILEELRCTDLNAMTPIQALNFVAKLQEISRELAAGSA